MLLGTLSGEMVVNRACKDLHNDDVVASDGLIEEQRGRGRDHREQRGRREAAGRKVTIV